MEYEFEYRVSQLHADTGSEQSNSPGWALCPYLILGKTHNGVSLRLVAMRKSEILFFMTKRHGNLFYQIVAMDNLERAYLSAAKGKRSYASIKQFEKNREANLEAIQAMLVNKTFTTSTYQTKKIFEPKPRDIYILPFSPDRIVQHALMAVIEPVWDKLMISDSYACRTGYGQHRGSSRCMEFVRRYKYCFKADVAKFYPSINQDIMASIVRQKIKCKDTLWLLDDIIYSYPGQTNMPIGNYTSQWLGNLYLNELDMFVKHKLKAKAYLRYCDDFCVFSDDKKWLGGIKAEVERFLFNHLQLKFSYADVFPVSHGVDFLGYRHFKSYILLRKSTALRVRRRLKRIPKLLAKHKITKEQARSSLASTRGWIKWANTHHLALSLGLEELEKVVEKVQ